MQLDDTTNSVDVESFMWNALESEKITNIAEHKRRIVTRLITRSQRLYNISGEEWASAFWHSVVLSFKLVYSDFAKWPCRDSFFPNQKTALFFLLF